MIQKRELTPNDVSRYNKLRKLMLSDISKYGTLRKLTVNYITRYGKLCKLTVIVRKRQNSKSHSLKPFIAEAMHWQLVAS